MSLKGIRKSDGTAEYIYADDTLSEENAPGEAKAAGDRIAGVEGRVTTLETAAPEIISNATKDWLDDNVTPTGSAVAIDSSLTQSGLAADAKAAGDAVNDLKSELNFVNSELLSINGSYYLDLEKKQRYVSNGQEAVANNAKWLSLRQGKYINFKAGDVVLSTEPTVYHFRVMTSTDNGSTWSMTSETYTSATISNDCIGWVSVIKTTEATLSDVDYINKNHVIVFQSSNYNALDQIDCKLNAISNVEIVGYNSGIDFVYVRPTDTAVSLMGGRILTVNSVSKDDKIIFKFDAEALENPENFTGYEFAIREVNSSESIIKSEFVQFPESNSIEYTVYYSAAVKLIVTLALYRSSTTVSANYYEPVRYSVSATKGGDSLSELLTESGETWEV